VDVVPGEEDGSHCARCIKVISPKSRLVMISAYPDREFRRLIITVFPGQVNGNLGLVWV
jgi:hypothetical protein